MASLNQLQEPKIVSVFEPQFSLPKESAVKFIAIGFSLQCFVLYKSFRFHLISLCCGA